MFVQPSHTGFAALQTILENSQILLADNAPLGLNGSPRNLVIAFSFLESMTFEAGENRVTCGRLYDIGRALSTAPGWFFEKFPGSEDLSLPDVDIMDLLMNGNSVDVVRLYNRLTAEQQKAIRVTLENLVAGNEAIADAAVQAGE